jgi:hypothetical protein
MDKNEIAVLLLSSAVIGAVSSALITALAQWRERVARERELLFTTAVDLSKTYMQRISVHSKAIGTLPELVILAGMHNILKEVFKKAVCRRKTSKR